MKILSYSLTILVIAYILFLIVPGCASKGSPGGGPIDRTPPTVTYTFPKTDSVNVEELKLMEIHFSESIDESSIFNNIFISPPLKFEAEWESDTELTIHFTDSLRKNQTYVVVIGAKVKDIRGNKLASSFQLAFATGNKIDKGAISGKVFGIESKDSYSIFVYDLQRNPEIFDQVIPDYISQTGLKSQYTVNYLRNGTYRVFAVNDQNNNLLIDANLENLGIPYRDITIDEANSFFKDLNFQPTKIDTVAPKLSYVRSLSSNKLNLNFSEKVTINSLDQIAISDSISQKTVSVLSTSESIEADNVLEVYTGIMDSGNVYLCSVSGFSDINGNVLTDTMLTFSVRGYSKPDSFQIITFNPADSSLNEHPKTKVSMEFSNPINKELFAANFKVLMHDTIAIAGDLKYPSAFEVVFEAQEPYNLNTYYSVQVNLKNIENIWGDSLADSLLIRTFRIDDGNSYGEISGYVKFAAEKPSVTHIKAENHKIKGSIYSTSTLSENSYKIKNVPDGIYRLHAYLDIDTNNVFSAGNLFPFTFSEPFIQRDDTIKVRKRWESTDVNFSFPKIAN